MASFTRRSDETVTAVDGGSREHEWPIGPNNYDEGRLEDTVEVPDLGGQTQQERWTEPIQQAGVYQELTSGQVRNGG